MENNKQQRIQELIKYLKNANAENWTLDIGALAREYNLELIDVRLAIASVYDSNRS